MASVMWMRLCQYEISISDIRLILSLVGKGLENLVSVPLASMKNKMVKKYEIQLFSCFWLKVWILNKENYIYQMFNVGVPNSHGAGGTWGFFEYRWRFLSRILSFPGKWLKRSWNTSITLKRHEGGGEHISQPSALLEDGQGWPQPCLDQGQSLREGARELSHPWCFQPSTVSLRDAPDLGMHSAWDAELISKLASVPYFFIGAIRARHSLQCAILLSLFFFKTLLIVLSDSSKGLVVFFPSDKTNTFESNKPWQMLEIHTAPK